MKSWLISGPFGLPQTSRMVYSPLISSNSSHTSGLSTSPISSRKPYLTIKILFNYKEGNFAIWDNMDEHWGNYTKWNKSEKDKHCSVWESLMAQRLGSKLSLPWPGLTLLSGNWDPVSCVPWLERNRHCSISLTCRIQKSQTQKQKVDWCLPGPGG